MKQRRLPNPLVGSLALATTAAVWVGGLTENDVGRSAAAMAFGIGFSTILGLSYKAGGVRLGDVKYAFPIGVAVGWRGSPHFLVMLFTIAAVGFAVGLASLVRYRTLHARIAYGPIMTSGLIAGLLA